MVASLTLAPLIALAQPTSLPRALKSRLPMVRNTCLHAPALEVLRPPLALSIVSPTIVKLVVPLAKELSALALMSAPALATNGCLLANADKLINKDHR